MREIKWYHGRLLLSLSGKIEAGVFLCAEARVGTLAELKKTASVRTVPGGIFESETSKIPPQEWARVGTLAELKKTASVRTVPGGIFENETSKIPPQEWALEGHLRN